MDAKVQKEEKDITPLTQNELVELTKETLFQKDTFERLYLIKDDLERTLMKQALEERAKELGKGLVTKLRNVLKTCESNFQKMRLPAQRERPEPRSTDFREIIDRDEEGNPIYGDETPYDGFLIPDDWMISNDGIYKVGAKNITTVCGRPMIITAFWVNLETKRQKAIIAHKGSKGWEEIEIPRQDISIGSSLAHYSDYGLDVNSKNVTNVVSFFADFINYNPQIKVYFTTKKLGWQQRKIPGSNKDISHNFMPYYKGLRFDAESSFRDLYNSISKRGSFDRWMSLVKGIREGKPLAPRIALAASFASALIYPLGVLSFFVDVFGATGGGKTITLMLACSVWANPNENRYIGDFSATRVALEMRLDMLNHLPLIIDDTSKKNTWVNYEYTVYDLASGKGKTRSNLQYGNEPERTWRNVIITNGEHALADQVSAMGAKNRVIEVSCEDHIYSSPYDVAETVKRNYGHAGEMFIEIIQKMDWDELKARHQKIQQRLAQKKVSGKQASSGAVLLLADEIATECIFKDRHGLEFDDVFGLLLRETEISEGIDAYQAMLDLAEANPVHFEGTNENSNCPSAEVWGVVVITKDKDGKEVKYIYWYINIYVKKLEEFGYSRKQFANWAKPLGILLTDQKRNDTKTVTRNGKSVKMVAMINDRTIIQNFYEKMVEDDGLVNEEEEIDCSQLEVTTIGELEAVEETPFDVDDPTFD